MQLWRYGRPIERLGQRYNLLGMLGSGGMADVCLAWDELEHRQVAIKAIKPDELDQRALDRFVKEADQVARWRHPHILRIYSDLKLELLDAAKGSIVPYMVMEYAQGGDLHKRLTPGKPFPLNKLLTVFPQLCSAVSYAHQRGVVHRDLKPLNILFRVLPSGEEQVVLSDFGLAVQMTTSQQTHAWGGTLPYMAPEQFEGRVLPASDIFALGVILYLLTTGHLPFQRSLRTLVDYRAGQDGQGQATSAIMYPPVPPSQRQPALSLAFDDVIACALNEEPGRRYRDALQLWQEASMALGEPDMLTSTYQRSQDTRRTRRSRATGYSTASMPLQPADRAASVAPAVSPAPVTIDTGHEEHGSYISTDGDIAAASSLVRRVPSTPSRSGSGPRDIEEIRLPSTPPAARGSASTSRSQAAQPGRNNRPGLPVPAEPLHRPARKNRVIFVGLLALLLLALVGGSIVYLPGLHNALPAGTPLLSNAVDVTIMPTSRTLSQVYQLTAITGNVDGAQMQVQARTVSAPAQSQQKSANATGTRKTAGSQAKGMLTFFNGAFTNQTVPAGTIITDKNGVQIVSDDIANIPPANPNTGSNGSITVAAHSVSGGATGNIKLMDINQTCCINDNTIFVKNLNPFTGGQDPKNYAFVQQSDVDAVANPLKGGLSQQGLSALRGQIGANEQPVTPLSANDCTTNVSSDQAIGDTGANVTTANVTVAVTCAVEAYDNAAVRAIVARQLTARAMTTLGVGYVLRAGRAIQQDITVLGVDQQHTVALSVQARGTWVYRFSDAQRQALAHQIAGKSRGDALALLQQSTGVASVSIPTRVTALPGDVNRINIVVNG